MVFLAFFKKNKERKDREGAFVNIGEFIEFKGSVLEFLENGRTRESQNPQKIAKYQAVLQGVPFMGVQVLR